VADGSTGTVDALARARAGSAEALGALLGSCRNYLRMLAVSCLDRDLRGKADASDVAQEALLRAHRSFPQFRGTTEPEWTTWLRRILVNCIADVHRRYAGASRKSSRERSLEAVVDRSSEALRHLVPSPGPSPSQAAERREAETVLADALAELEPDDAEVVVLRNLRELGWEEIGERMGRSPDAARMLWTRAIRRVGALVRSRAP
jgi:RNA polymerase sigma-70 factor (ECF subfamily)